MKIDNTEPKQTAQLTVNNEGVYDHMGFPGGSTVKNPPPNAGDAGDVGLIPRLGRSPGRGNGNLFSSILAWKIPGTEEPGGVQSMRSQTVRHKWVTEHTHMVTCRKTDKLS